MDIQESRPSVKELSTRLLDERAGEEEVNKTIDEINRHFWELLGVTEKKEDLDHLAGVPSKAGIALSYNHAAECLLDYNRTVKFLQGFVAAIKNKQKQYPNETIQIFYAGCGPLAPFVTLIAPLFTPEEVQFSLLEINSRSLKTAKSLVKELELTEYIQEYYLADAITFEIPNPEKIHILFSETLDALLHRECYVPILWNLLPQLSEEVTVVPHNVRVKLNFKVDDKETFGAVVFDTRKVLAETKKAEELPETLSPTIVSLEDAEQYYSIVLDTEVQIYDNLVLTRSESSLTLALEIPIHKPIVDKGVVFRYHLLPLPALKIEMQGH